MPFNGSQVCAFATRALARAWATQVESGMQRQHATAQAVTLTLGELLERCRQEVLPRKKTRTQTNQV